MAVIPITSTTGDPVFRAQSGAINSIKGFSRVAADAATRLNNQERIVSPGDDSLSFATSRRLRTDISALKVVSETGQVNITALGLALSGLDSIKGQLDKISASLVQAQSADPSDYGSIQADIDLALSQIDSTAKNTKLGNRSLLDGGSTIGAFSDIATTGVRTNFAAQRGESVAANAGINGVRVNKIGFGGPLKTLNDGSRVLCLRVSAASQEHARKASLTSSTNAAAADWVEFRITGKLGSATLRLQSTGRLLTQAALGAKALAFNELADQTGVVMTSKTGAADFSLATVGFGSDEFIKVELIAKSGTVTGGFGGLTGADPLGTTITAYGTAGYLRVNGSRVQLGGEFGTTARYQQSGFDIEIDVATNNLLALNGTGAYGRTLNIALGSGIKGLLGSTGNGSEVIHYGIGDYSSTNLGKHGGGGVNTVTVLSTGARLAGTLGNKLIGGSSVADLGTAGQLQLTSGNLKTAIATVNRAISQVTEAQTRLGSVQATFIDAVNRAEVGVGNLSAADADIIGVDAATEITNLIQSQLGISTASAVLSQANAIQANIFSLLAG